MSWKLKGDNGMVFRIHLKDNFKVWLSPRGERGYSCILIYTMAWSIFWAQHFDMHLCVISFLYLHLYVLGDDAWIS